MLKLTNNAAEQIFKAAKSGNMQGLALRLAATLGGEDNTVQYAMGFDEIKEDDVHVNSKGVDIVFEPIYKELLSGTVIDYVELEPNNFRFIFMNPNDPNFIPPSE